MNIYLDIETCPSQLEGVREMVAEGITCPGNITKAESIAAWEAEKKPALVEEAWRKTSFDGALGHVAVIGLAFDDEEPFSIWSPDWHSNEAHMLREAFDAIHERCSRNLGDRPLFVGHNVVEFDFRFLFQRAVMLGVKPTPFIPFNAKPWDDAKVFDTMARWGGARNPVKLDKLARAMGVGGKGEIDGSKVWDYVRDGLIGQVAEYCENDISMTRGVFQRMTFTAPIVAPAEIEEELPF